MINKLQAVFITLIIGALAVHNGICVKIVEGHDAKRGTGLFMASIQNANEHICGGVLIHKQWVLTSADCAEKGLTVVIGTRSLKDAKEDNKFRSIEAKKHDRYNKNTEWNNLALLKLNKAVKNKFAKPLSLPRSPKDIKPGTECKVLGWGETIEDDDEDPSDILQETTVFIIDRKICNSPKYRNGYPVVNDDMLCAAGKSKKEAKMCKGDAGGPLICKSLFLKDSLTGIAIFGMKCGHKDNPGIYTRLSERYIKWIRDTIKSKTNNTSIEQEFSETTYY